MDDNKAIKVLLADDHSIVREGLKRVIEEDNSISVVAEAEHGIEAIQEYEEKRPDVVVLDIFMPLLDGLDTIKQLLLSFPDARILMLTMVPEQQYAFRTLKAGALGYITKGTSPKELHKAIHTVAQGRRYLSDEGKDTILVQLLDGKADMDSVEALSDRELQVLYLLARGNKMKDISKSLSLSVRTIETYRSRIMLKLHLSNRSELIEFSLRNKIL